MIDLSELKKQAVSVLIFLGVAGGALWGVDQSDDDPTYAMCYYKEGATDVLLCPQDAAYSEVDYLNAQCYYETDGDFKCPRNGSRHYYSSRPGYYGSSSGYRSSFRSRSRSSFFGGK